MVLRLLAWSSSFAACVALAASNARAQSGPQLPAPGAEASIAAHVARGRDLLDLEDPMGAWEAFRRAALAGADPRACLHGLGRSHLMLGHSAFATAYAEAGLRFDPADQAAMALCVRAMIRARRFDDAVATAGRFVQRTATPNAELLAARASSLFRVQRIDEAAAGYRMVVGLDPLHAEGHLRLGSGLLPPTKVGKERSLESAVALLAVGERSQAIAMLQAVLDARPNHPIAHRLLGETLFTQRAMVAMAATDPAFQALASVLPHPDVRNLPIASFVPGYTALSAERRAVVDRTAAMFRSRLGKLVAIGGRHDLLTELERTTDGESRANLRGRRTFDGRVWDDVRGVGGVQAATGIEALDDAAMFGFDTFAHEVAHQVHTYAFTPLQKARLKSLYDLAMLDGRCLDYYAASNEWEYFGQGVEAFASLGKRPGCETTHGHTRFELRSKDPALHDFIAGVVDFDPLADAKLRDRLLEAAVAVALRCGRAADAELAAAMLAPGATRDRLVADAARALATGRCH